MYSFTGVTTGSGGATAGFGGSTAHYGPLRPRSDFCGRVCQMAAIRVSDWLGHEGAQVSLPSVVCCRVVQGVAVCCSVLQ